MSLKAIGPWNPNSPWVGRDGKLTAEAMIWLSLLNQQQQTFFSNASFAFQTITAGAASNQFRNNTGYALTPASLDCAANLASATGATLLDVQISSNQLAWASILQAGGLSLPKGATSIATVKTFAASPTIPAGYWCRAVVQAGSATDAQQVSLLVGMTGAGAGSFAGIDVPVPLIRIPHAYVQMTTTDTITLDNAGTRVALTFDTKVSDSGGFWSAAHNTRLTIPQTGDYLVFYTAPACAAPTFMAGSMQITVTTGAGVSYSSMLNFAPAYFQIRKNGDNAQVFAGCYGEGYTWQASAGGFGQFTDIGPHAAGTAILSLAAGDYLELAAWQNYVGAADSAVTYPPAATTSQVPSLAILGPI